MLSSVTCDIDATVFMDAAVWNEIQTYILNMCLLIELRKSLYLTLWGSSSHNIKKHIIPFLFQTHERNCVHFQPDVSHLMLLMPEAHIMQRAN